MGLTFKRGNYIAAESYYPAARSITNSTAAAWVRVNGGAWPVNEWAWIVAVRNADDPFYNPDIQIPINLYLDHYPGQPVELAFYRGYWGAWWDLTNSPLLDGEWHHVAVTSNALDTPARFYLDGVEQGAPTRTIIDADAWALDWRRGSSVDYVQVGHHTTAPVSFDLSLAEVATWSEVLSDAEIGELAAGRLPSTIRSRSLVSYARCLTDARNYVGDGDVPASDTFALAGARETIVGSAAVSHTVNYPVEKATGDYCYLIASTHAFGHNTPTGWTLRSTDTGAGEISVYTRKLDGTEGASFTVTCSGSTTGIYHVYAFRGADRIGHLDDIVTGLSVPLGDANQGSRVFMVHYARTRRTDNTLDVDPAFDATFDSETAASNATTAHGRLVSGILGPVWSNHVYACTGASTGNVDGVRSGSFAAFAYPFESGQTGNIEITDHPPAVLNWEAPARPRTVAIAADGSNSTPEVMTSADSELDYLVDWSAWLDPHETIAGFSATNAAESIDGNTDGVIGYASDGYRMTVWARVGVNPIDISLAIATTGGRLDSRRLHIVPSA